MPGTFDIRCHAGCFSKFVCGAPCFPPPPFFSTLILESAKFKHGRALLNDVQRKRRSELPGNSSKRPKPGLTPQGKARAPKAAPKQVAKAKAKAKGAAAPK